MNGIHILQQQHHVDVSSLDTSLLQRLFIQLHSKYTVRPTKSLANFVNSVELLILQ